MIECLPRTHWPTFARADCGHGSEASMNEFEERELPCLFKLRPSPKVKQLLRELLQQSEGWQDAGEGWHPAEATLRLQS